MGDIKLSLGPGIQGIPASTATDNIVTAKGAETIGVGAGVPS